MVNKNLSKDEIWRRLLESKRDKEIERQQVKNELDQEEMTNACSFHPEINELSKAMADAAINYEDDFSDRLYQDAFERMRRQKLSNLEHCENEDIYAFQPKTN